jgi:tRNA nucleotidyltransferase (CCA-adding enzyme)
VPGEPDAIERLAAAVPPRVRDLCRRLGEQGHQAYVVGGAVRDALLGRVAKEWDVATDARPEQVSALFARTIPTGIQHGTVTVLMGTRAQPMAVEVTTYRGEGAYSDHRRPDTVVFGVPLDRDLARRDFTVNAMAFDPAGRGLVDPFGGQADLAAGRLRAVGDAAARFDEDGLRVLRAVRFVATLELALEPATEAAIPGALAALAQVAKERVRDELGKLLGAARPSLGLAVAARTGVLQTVLPELADASRVFAAVDALPVDPILRLAVLAGAAPVDSRRPILARLRLTNDERDRILGALAAVDLDARPDWTDGELRRFLARTGVPAARDALALRRVARPAGATEVDELARRVDRIVTAGDALRVADLAVTGRDVMRVLSIPAGPRVGQILERLLARVLDDPAENTAARLETALPAVARDLAK